ncbi:hypothetical protein IMCC21906_00154 [Spongiibacter sp. IMCC21906]|uniref:hypothetical protein n=1 Tax=Spongiibacter sp. IMCC21906 TaxID=1620392 RepID=UPI00062DCBF5|nr:hypothetical protein [Spongiibacter sp. IMCC21906]AKH67848.1 hypothetical protein IMCC21906_00154 [Spongiibacter sp. IMCC21906]
MTRFDVSSLGRGRVYFLLILVSALLSGTYYPRLLLNFNGFYFLELLLVPSLLFVVLANSRAVLSSFISALSLWGYATFILVPFMAILLGLLYGISLSDQVSHVRSIIYFFVFFVLVKKVEIDSRSLVWFLVFGSGILALYLLFYINHQGVILNEEYSNKYRLPFLLMLALLVSASRLGLPIVFIILSGFFFYLAMLSNYRIYLFLLAMSVFPVWHYSGLSKSGAAKKSFFLVAIFLSGAWVSERVGIFDYVYNLIFDDEARYSQIIAKSDALVRVFSGSGVASEQSFSQRFYYLEYLVSHIYYFLFPIGLGDRSVGPRLYSDFPLLNSIDSGVLYMSLHYGLISSIFLVFFVFHRMVIFSLSLNHPDGRGFSFLFFVAAVYFFVTTEIFFVPEIAVVSGLAVGVMANKGLWLFRVDYKND